MLLADEPTGNLDSTTSEEIITLFKELHADGQTIVMVTHEEDIAGHAERIVRLRDGKIMSDHPTDEDPIHRAFLEQSAHVARARAGASQMMREDDPTAAARDMVETTRQLDPDAESDPDAAPDPQPDARPEPAAAGEPSR
jgi:energy-coupling factor transporter ATP-binding protein EcfA2